MSEWKWYAGLMPVKEKCGQCQHPFRWGDGTIVVWTDSKLYHVGCLLDRLAAPPPLLDYTRLG